MVARVRTVAFQGIEAVPVDVQVMIAPGKVDMQIVGLADKAVAESRERVQAALHASGLSMPPKKVTVNLAPADLPKEGSHYDLPIALGLMAALGAIPGDMLGELCGARRTGARRHDRGGRRRAAGGHRRQRRGQGPDLPARLRAGGGLGRQGHRHPGAAQPDRARQSFPRHAGAVAAGGRHPRRRRATCPTSPTSRARRAPSGRSRWRRPAATIF